MKFFDKMLGIKKGHVKETSELLGSLKQLRNTFIDMAEKNKKLKILLIENGEGEHEKAYFEQRGHEVFLVSTADEGLKLYTDKKGEIDAIVLELNLPDKNGIDILTELINEKIQKLVITATKPTIDTIVRIKELHASFLSKPFDFDLALRCLKYGIG